MVAEINETTSIEDQWREAVRGASYSELVNECVNLVQNAFERQFVEKNGLEILKKYPQTRFMAQNICQRVKVILG